VHGMEGLELTPQGRNLRTELRDNARGVRGGSDQRLGGSSRWWEGRGLACPWAGPLSTKVHQHVILVEFDIAGKDPASLRIKRLGCQLGFECMENGDYPVDSLRTVLWTRGRDSGDSKGLASIGASFRGPGPAERVDVKVMENRTRDCRRGKTSSEGAFGEGMVTLSYL